MIKNITLSADEELIQNARNLAQMENSTLNARFREWLHQYVKSQISSGEYDNLMENLNYAKANKTFSRDEFYGPGASV